MKKFFTLALLCFVAIASYGATTTGFINGVNYTIYDDGTASVYSFYAYATDFTEEIVIPETLYYDGNGYTVTSVEASGLQGISQVTRITVTTVSLPSTIESLGNFALSGCTTVSTIYCYAETPPSLGNNSLSKVSATVYVPESSVSAYEEAWTTTATGATSLSFVGISSAPGDTGGSGDSPVMVITPANGDEVKASLSEIVVSCEDGIELNANNSMYFQVFDKDNTVVAGAWNAVAVEDADGIVRSYTLPLYDDAITTSDVPITLTTAGEYTFTLPDKSFYLGSEKQESASVDVSFTLVKASEVAKTFDYTLDPPAGEVSSLHSITISYEDGIKLNAKETSSKSDVLLWSDAKVYDEGGNEVVEVVYASPIIGEGYYTEATYIGYTFSLGKDMSSQDVTAAGEYDFVIPAGYISFYDAESGQYVETTEDITAHYIITSSGTSQPLTYEVNPVEGEVTSLSKITFLREAGIVSQVGEEGQMALSKLYVCDANYNPVAYVGGVSDTADDNWKLYSTSITYELTNEVVDEGTYHFIVPAGAFAMYDNGDYIDCEDIELTYYVTGGDEAIGLVFDPESNTTHKSLSGFTVTYTGEGGMSVTTMPNDGASVYLEGGDGEEYTYATYEEIYDDDSGLCVSVEFTFAKELTEDGTYDVVIPAELLYYGHGGVNEEDIILVYIIDSKGEATGINGIGINGENVEGIYSVGGQKLNTMVKGVNIVRMNDGTTKKLLVK